MMTEDVFKKVDQEVHSEEFVKLTKKCIDLLNKSRGAMKKRYEHWDAANSTYLGEVSPDAEDKKAREKKEPEKGIVPLTF